MFRSRNYCSIDLFLCQQLFDRICNFLLLIANIVAIMMVLGTDKEVCNLKSLGQRLKDIRLSNNLTMEELAKRFSDNYGLNVNKSMISRWENDKAEPTNTHLSSYAKEFGADMNYLVGIDAPDTTPVDLSHSILIPVLGSIPAGIPIEAVEDVIEHIDIPEKWVKSGDEYFGLRVNGDSMYPLLLDGDTVVIRRQPTAETGDICACYVNGFDATLKRIKLTEGSITLKPENPSYPPTTYTHPGEVTIAGKVVELRRSI